MRRSRTLAALFTALVPVLMLSASTLAQEEPAPATSVQVDLLGEDATAPAARAVLTARDSSTTVQVLAPGAAAGTTVVIHAGTCAAVGADVVGLIGEVVTGQAQGIVPVALSLLADGGHVVMLHPGIDFTTALACGVIPLTAVGPVASVGPGPVVGDCAGVAEWLTGVKAHLARLAELDAELARQTTSADYLATLATNIGQTQAIVMTLESAQVPAAAAEAHQQLIDALRLGIEAATDVSISFTTSDPALYQRALTKANESSAGIVKVRTAVGLLEGRCPPPAA
jgi:hypothetical protein